MYNPLEQLKLPGVVVFAVVVVVLGFNELVPATIHFSTVAGLMGVCLLLTWLICAGLVIADLLVGVLFGLKDTGRILHTLFGVGAGTGTMMACELFFPGSIALGNAGAFNFALMTTALVWVLGYLTELIKPGDNFLPVRRTDSEEQ